jgi:integrase/recombinase XerD
LKIFNEYLGDVEIEEVKSIDVKAFTIFNKERGLKQKSQNIYVTSIRALYSYLIEEEIVMKSLGYSVKLLNAKDKKDIEIFTNDEIKKLIS